MFLKIAEIIMFTDVYDRKACIVQFTSQFYDL